MFKHINSFPKISTKNPRVSILYITYNRIYYTKNTLPALLNSSSYPFDVYIVDNGSTDGTIEYLQEITHPKINQIIFNKKNEGLVNPTKKFWKTTDSELIGKIDNDILVPTNWVENLVEAHTKIPNLGAIGYSHFRVEDYDNTTVKNKVNLINGIHIRQQPWIGGNYIMKRTTTINYKGYKQSRKFLKKRILYGFNAYQELLSKNGFIHGYLCNKEKELLTWDHLDDPRHEMFYKDDNYYKIRNMTEKEIIKWFKKDAKNLLEGGAK